MNRAMEVLIDRDRIALRVQELASELGLAFRNREAVVVGILGGSFIFLADLIRNGNFASELDFLWLESYEGNGSSGRISVRQDLHVDVAGKDVLIVDDILDTGLTLGFTRNYLSERGANSIRAAVLVRKDRQGSDPALAEHVGFVIPDRFVVGYGLDYYGRYRHLPDICCFSPEKERP